MRAWSGEGADAMGPTVTRASSPKPNTPPLKNGNDLRESGYLISVGSRTARFRRKHSNKMVVMVAIVLILLLLCLAIVMTVLYVKLKRTKPPRLCESKECLRSAANLALSIDKTVDPCDDFYRYACGNWAEDHPRPDTYRSYDWFREKQIRVYSTVRDFLSKNDTLQPIPVQQAKDMYAACMDTDSLNKKGLSPALSILEAVGLPKYPTFINATEVDYNTYVFDWLETVIKIKTHIGMDVLIGFDIFTDPKNSSQYRLVMGSPETTNPFPSMYKQKKHNTRRKNSKEFRITIDDNAPDETFTKNFEDHLDSSEKKSDKDSEEKVAEIYKILYGELIKQFLTTCNSLKDSGIDVSSLDDNIKKAATEFYSFDNDMYELESDNDTHSDDDFLHIPEYTADEIQSHTDAIAEANDGTPRPIWKKYLEEVFAISDTVLDFDTDKILVSEPDMKYMSLMATYVSRTPPVILELYIWIKVAEVMAVHTTSELRILFHKNLDELKSKKDTGMPPRSLQCASAVNDMLGMAVAYAIADRNFLNGTKPKVEIMLHEMKNALAHLVGQTKWMDDNTKLATYQKIIQMKTLIGFPEWLLEEGKLEEYYQGIEIDKEKHLDNMINIIQKKIKKALNKFREGNNFTWATDPTEVNAYHTFQENTITIPLVMLQRPFFDLGLDSLNYGSLGTVLGHEITHGFDNFGRQFDKNGNLLPWWTNETIDSFVNQTQCFVEQYSAFYVPELDDHIDGKKTLGENIADNGGVREALAALKEHLRKFGPEEKLPGFEDMNSEQLFFLAYGNLWCGVSTKDSLQAELEDEHSPQEYRAKGALQNNEDFARAWHCRLGSPMNPKQRCIIF